MSVLPTSLRRYGALAATRLEALAQLSRDNRLLALSMLFWGMGEGLFLYIQPLYLQQLGARPDDIGGILGATQLVMGASFIPAGWLADRLGRRPMLIAGWLAGLGAAALMAAATDLRVFVTGLVLYALAGFVVPIMSSYITAARGTMSIQQAMSLVFAAFALGSIPSPTVGGWIGEHWGLPLVYRLSLIFIGASTLVVFFLGDQRAHEVHAAGPRPGPSLWRTRDFVRLMALVFASGVLMWLALPLAPNFLKNERGFDVANIGTLGTVAAVGGIVLPLWLGHGRPRRTLVVAQGLMLGAVLLLWQAAWLPLLGVAYFLRPSLSLARLSASALTARVVERHQIGTAYGVLETAFSLAFVFASFAAGQLYNLRPDAPFVAAAVLLPVLMALTQWSAPHAPGLPPESAGGRGQAGPNPQPLP